MAAGPGTAPAASRGLAAGGQDAVRCGPDPVHVASLDDSARRGSQLHGPDRRHAGVRDRDGAVRQPGRILPGRAGRVAGEAPTEDAVLLEIVATNRYGQVRERGPLQTVHDRSQLAAAAGRDHGRASDGLLTGAALQGDVRADYGRLVEARGWKPCAGPRGDANGAIELDGRQGVIKFAIEEFPERDYTVSIWVRVTELPGTRLGQIFSAWSRGMDDPLRLVVQGDQLFARLEAGQFYGTQGYKLQTGIWYHVAAVKQADKLTLYVDGAARSTAAVPLVVAFAAENFALGSNPNYVGGPEFLAAQLADLRFYVRALTAEEVQSLFQAGAGKTNP